MSNTLLNKSKRKMMKALTIPCLLSVLAVPFQTSASQVVLNNVNYNSASVVDAAELANLVYNNNVNRGFTTQLPGSRATFTPLSPTILSYDIQADRGLFGTLIGEMTYANGVFHESLSGGELAVFQAGTKLVIAFRGTEIDSIDDFLTDVALPVTNNSLRAFSTLLDDIATYAQNNNLTITVTGHSLGGALVNKLADSAAANNTHTYYNNKKKVVYVAFASPILASNSNVFNFGFENDPIYGIGSFTTHTGNIFGSFLGEPAHIENIYFAPESSTLGKNPAAHSMINYLPMIKKFVINQKRIFETKSDIKSAYTFKTTQKSNPVNSDNTYGSYFGSSRGGHVITGNAKNNYFSISGENNTIFGKEGKDYVSLIKDSALSVIGTVTTGVDASGRHFKQFGSNVFYNVENFGGSLFNDTLTMWGNGDLYGYAGNDRLTLKASGKLYGGSGNDYLSCLYNCSAYGGEGNDTIFGSAQNDYINGGSGADRMTGGQGLDTFYFSDYASFNNVITDFNPNQDFIELSKSIYTWDITVINNVTTLGFFDSRNKLIGDVYLNGVYSNANLNIRFVN